MYQVQVTPDDMSLLPVFFGAAAIAGLETLSMDQHMQGRSELDTGQILDRWRQNGWISAGDAAGNSDETNAQQVFDPRFGLLFSVMTKAGASMTCTRSTSKEDFWGAYFLRDVIVLSEFLPAERLYRICWVPTIDLAIGSLYGWLQSSLPKDGREEPTQRKIHEAVQFPEDGPHVKCVFLENAVRTEETAREKPAYEQIKDWSYRLAKMHGGAMKEVLEDGRLSD